MTAPDWYQKSFGEDYLALYPHRDKAEAGLAVELIRSRTSGMRVDRVLDLACGAGRHSRALAERWWTAGYDLSEPLLRVARTEAPTVSFVRGDIRVLPFAKGSFSLVVNLFTSFGYFASDREHEQVIAEVADVVAQDGLFALDYLNAPKVIRTLNPYDERVVNGTVVEQRRRISDDGRFVEKKITLRGKGKSFDERVRLFSRADLETMLTRSGFVIREVMGDYSGAAWSDDSDRTFLLAAKR
jgi:Methylase involved in ubiquinone/menaquinone biosynthesis